MEYLKFSEWIWCNDNPMADEYGEFVDEFEYSGKQTFLYISADSNYEVFVNGKLVAFGQYADFPYDKVYDKIDISDWCRNGKNRLAVRVWYYGIDNSSTYCLGKAGLLYSVADEQILCKSDTETKSRISKAYQNHNGKIITNQLGLSYCYDGSKEDNWINEDIDGFCNSIKVNQELPLRVRPCKRLKALPTVVGTEVKRLSDTRVIYDLGKEYAGFLSLNLVSQCNQKITISYGEHINDDCVRRIIDHRDFSVEYIAKTGDNVFENHFRRLACRYIEVESEAPIDINSIGITPTVYEVKKLKRPSLTETQKTIYDMCIETLRLCMHEHYEDCPWREQALYTMDSRNQMLCGYYAFGEYEFARANLELISKDNRKDGLLSICYPVSNDFVIPSFSLHYIIACKEYLDYSNDMEFLRRVYPKLENILSAFKNNMENSLVRGFKGKQYWNFYEWRSGLDGEDKENTEPDLILNCLYSLAMQKLSQIADRLNIDNTYCEQARAVNAKINEVFCKSGIYYDNAEYKAYSQLGNSLAVLCGVADDMAEDICQRIISDANMTPISLSMCCFVYDALLKTDKEKYKDYILLNIEKTYIPMIESGSTTVWETELGEKDFENAGSMCHGWSAIPVYYYNILN